MLSTMGLGQSLFGCLLACLLACLPASMWSISRFQTFCTQTYCTKSLPPQIPLAANLSASELVESTTHIPISTFKPIINVSALQGVNSMAHHHLSQLSKLHASQQSYLQSHLVFGP
jgi:hypothetical protein